MHTDAGVLWSVLEEHLDEAEFLLDRFEAALSSPEHTLDTVARTFEGRLVAHLDALVIAGPAALSELLAPAIDAEEPSFARIGALVMAALACGRFDVANAALYHAADVVRRAAVRACSLAPSPAVDAWIVEALAAARDAAERAALIEIAVDRGVTVPALDDALRGAPEEIAPALRATWGADPARYEAPLLALLDHASAQVRDAAMIALLHHGSPHAWGRCEQLALDPATPHPLAMALVAGLGGPAHHAHLSERLASDAHRAGALRALGLSGDVAALPLLLFHARSEDARAARLATEALATIAGAEIDALPPRATPDAAGPSLPPLEEDDLDADLVPGPEARLPLVDAAALDAWWAGARGRFDPQRRYLGGVVATRAAFAEALLRFPMRRRYLVALLLSIRSGGRGRVSTRGFTGVQRRQIAGVAAERDAAWVRVFSGFG